MCIRDRVYTNSVQNPPQNPEVTESKNFLKKNAYRKVSRPLQLRYKGVKDEEYVKSLERELEEERMMRRRAESELDELKTMMRTWYKLSLIHICRCRRSTLCRSRWSPYH
eukprot:TRINITY_DN1680_c0_g1_i15.p2 TRINITY_DN1680_c0_g1~~TRINITY_DN1680_c0_g1_i15.p2  ORF type:complete len:110 (+),score=31.34 TRINITY_DN1680_c0_g1_i15:102-431(+)